MRKFYILLAAVATLALSAACSKVVMSADGPGEKAISFEVANYMPRTKANVAFDTGKTFTTYSWSYNRDDKPEEMFPFMNPATVGFDGKVWKATNRPYYWPKTDSLNFVSFANTPVPETVMSQDVARLGNVIVVSYGHYGIANMNQGEAVEPAYVTIVEDDDALLAEAAFHYHWNRGEAWDHVSVDQSDPGFTGVPTLFHHLLSKVTIQVLFDASGAEDGYEWNLKVNRASFTCVNEGILQALFVEPVDRAPVTVWPFDDDVNWTPRNDDDGYAVLVEKRNPSGEDAQSGIAGEETYVAGGDPEPIVLWDDISVLPQMLFSDQQFSFNFTLTSTYNGGNPLVETIDLSGIPFWNPKVGGFSPDIDAWKMGHRYIYTITIKPNTAVKFDPAEVDWTVEEIDYPY